MSISEVYPGYRKLELRELQLLQLEAMKHIHNICVENNIQYYLIAGSILGAVRHGGFIPWDDDIDIALMRDEYERFKNIFSEKCDGEKYFLQHYGSDKGHKPALMRVCIKNTILVIPGSMHQKYCHNTYLDIFPLDNVPDDENQRLAQASSIMTLRKRINDSYYISNPHNTGFRVVREYIKSLKSFCNSLIYPKVLTKRLLEKEMMRYDNDRTECVCSMASGYSYQKQAMPRSYYGTPTLVTFEDTQFYGPENANLYLTHLYGKDYMIPRNKYQGVGNHEVFIKK